MNPDLMRQHSEAIDRLLFLITDRDSCRQPIKSAPSGALMIRDRIKAANLRELLLKFNVDPKKYSIEHQASVLSYLYI